MSNYFDVSSLYPKNIVNCLKGNNLSDINLQTRFFSLHYRLWDDLYKYFKNVNKHLYIERKRFVKQRIYSVICKRNNLRPNCSGCFLCDYCYITKKMCGCLKSKCQYCPGYVKDMSSCMHGLYDSWLCSDGDELLEITKEIRDIVLKGVD